MNRGEIWQFEFHRPDKRRPVVILTRQEMIPYLHTVTVAPITRTIRGVPSEVLVGLDEGLREPSAINFHHMVTVPKSGLHHFVGTISPAKMRQIQAAMCFALGFEE